MGINMDKPKTKITFTKVETYTDIFDIEVFATKEELKQMSKEELEEYITNCICDSNDYMAFMLGDCESKISDVIIK